MGAIIIKADKSSNLLLKELAEKLGAKVFELGDEQYDDFALGTMMDKVKTGKTVSKNAIMKKLKS